MWPSLSSPTQVLAVTVISSRPSSPWTSRAWRQPRPLSTRASFSTSASSGTPTTWARTPAGLVSGPRILNTVRMPISRLGAAAYFMAGWKSGANMKPMPTSSRQAFTCAASRSILTPNASSTSALPQELLMARLPCLATLSPAPATTKAAAVEMLIVLALSPPVPQVSTRGPATTTGTALALIARASPMISSTVSPLSLSAVTKAPICAGVASPAIISPITEAASSIVSERPETNIEIASLIILAHSLRKFLSRSLPLSVINDSG